MRIIDIFELPDHAQLILNSLCLAVTLSTRLKLLLLERLAGADNSTFAVTSEFVVLLSRIHVSDLELSRWLMRRH